MKKIIVLFLSLLCTKTMPSIFSRSDSNFTGAFTAGFVFKHDPVFKAVYGRGITNVITADGCYHPFKYWGIGAKVSYWFVSGETTFFNRESHLHEVPFTLYLRGILNFQNGLRLYASLGGGGIWAQEKNYLGCTSKTRGIGEAEVGLNYSIRHRLNFTS